MGDSIFADNHQLGQANARCALWPGGRRAARQYKAGTSAAIPQDLQGKQGILDLSKQRRLQALPQNRPDSHFIRGRDFDKVSNHANQMMLQARILPQQLDAGTAALEVTLHLLQ
jgi:hypothetical protein